MSDHKHITGLSAGWGDSHNLTSPSENPRLVRGGGSTRFSFCPECGASLEEYWKAHDENAAMQIDALNQAFGIADRYMKSPIPG